jgi:hypothetical protein
MIFNYQEILIIKSGPIGEDDEMGETYSVHDAGTEYM